MNRYHERVLKTSSQLGKEVFMKKLLMGILLWVYATCSFASLISVQSLQITPAQETLLGGELAPLFTILDLGVLTAPSAASGLLPDFIFPGTETVLGFASKSVTNSVRSSESASSDGTRTRTDQNIRTIESRVLLDIEISNLIGIEGFSISDIELRPEVLLFDFSAFNVLPLSELVLSVTFSVESFEEIINETTNIFDNSMIASTPTQVNAPSSLAIVLTLVVMILVSRLHRAPKRKCHKY